MSELLDNQERSARGLAVQAEVTGKAAAKAVESRQIMAAK